MNLLCTKIPETPDFSYKQVAFGQKNNELCLIFLLKIIFWPKINEDAWVLLAKILFFSKMNEDVWFFFKTITCVKN